MFVFDFCEIRQIMPDVVYLRLQYDTILWVCGLYLHLPRGDITHSHGSARVF